MTHSYCSSLQKNPRRWERRFHGLDLFHRPKCEARMSDAPDLPQTGMMRGLGDQQRVQATMRSRACAARKVDRKSRRMLLLCAAFFRICRRASAKRR